MGRKRKKQTVEFDEGERCNNCDTIVWHDGPLSGVIGDIGKRRMVICANCATQLMSFHAQMRQRWGQ